MSIINQPKMNNFQKPDDPQQPEQPNRFEGLLWIILFILIIIVSAIFIQRNWQSITKTLGIEGPVDFDKVMNNKGLHDITLDNGRAFDISYEASFKRDFSGLVRHASPIQESAFGILTYDILITSRDFANSDLVDTSVSNHHFTWISRTDSQPQGTINLLHTVPLNNEVNQELSKIQSGDTVIVTGYDVYRIEGYDPQGKYIGFWQDSGCNTTLVTKVQIIK
jgi:hypothetical protein